MDLNILAELLRNCSFLSDLEESQQVEFLNKCEKLEISEGDYLFKENETGNALFILVKGKLIVTTTYKTVEKIIGYVQIGEVVGELSLFSNKPRSASVKALYPSIVLRLQRDEFQTLCYKNPKILWHVSTLIANRSQSNIAFIRSETRTHTRIITIVSIDEMENGHRIFEQFKKQNKPHYKIQMIDYSTIKSSDNPASVIKQALEHGNTVIYSLPFTELQNENEILKLSDKIMIVVHADRNTPESLKETWDKYIEKNVRPIEKELLLIHDSFKLWYPNTNQWFRLGSFSRWYHASLDTPSSLQRVLRFLSGNCIGLVLSGGGAKGWAHAGVIQALFERNIPIDYLGGTSMGALAGAFRMISRNGEEFTKLCFSAWEGYGTTILSPKNITLPLVSLVSGKAETEIYKKQFDDIMIQDLAIPYFAVSCNLSSYSAHIWDTGYLWEACRASTSIPFILPPLIYNNQIHIDGGLLNNFPIDVMNDKFENRGFVIGVDVSSFNVDPEKYFLPPHLTFWEALKIKLGLRKAKYLGMLEMIGRTIQVASIDRAVQNARRCDLLIRPKVEGCGFADFDKKHELVAIGYREAQEQLAHFPILDS